MPLTERFIIPLGGAARKISDELHEPRIEIVRRCRGLAGIAAGLCHAGQHATGPAVQTSRGPRGGSCDIVRLQQDRSVGLGLSEHVLAADKGLDVRPVLHEGLHDVALVGSEMVLQRFAADRAGNRGAAIQAGEGDGITPAVVTLLRICEQQGSGVGQAERFQDRQDRGQLNVLFSLFKTRDRTRADLRDFREALLRYAELFAAADCLFDKSRPIESKVPFHRLSM